MKGMNISLSEADLKGVPFRFRATPPVRSRLIVGRYEGGATLRVDTPAAYPSAWVRFWHWALLGWEWEKVEG